MNTSPDIFEILRSLDLFQDFSDSSIEGISNLLIKNLDELDAKERPIHCSDKKRLQFYIKDEDKWKKRETNKKIDISISKVAHKHLAAID